MSEDALRVVAGVMALTNLAVLALVLRWERPGRTASLRAPADWRVPRLGTMLMVAPLAYPVLVVFAPGWLTWPVSPALRSVGIALWALGLAGVLWCVRVMRGQTGADGIVVGHRLVTA